MTREPYVAAGGSIPPIAQAKEKTETLQQVLEVASAELTLTNAALDRHLPDAPRHADVHRALQQNTATEQKVQEAAEELAEVSDLLAQETVQRARLEAQLARARSTPRSP